MRDSRINYLVDAGPIVAAFDKSDQWHRWSAAVLDALNEPLYTTETVLAEICHHLRKQRSSVQAILDFVSGQGLRICPVFPDASARIAGLMKKYPDVMDLGDATLVALSERYPRARLITVDRRDFSFYRRHDGCAVPTIMPDVE